MGNSSLGQLCSFKYSLLAGLEAIGRLRCFVRTLRKDGTDRNPMRKLKLGFQERQD